MSSEPVLLVERRDAVLVLTMNRPEVRNAVNKELAEAIAEQIDLLDGDDSLRVGVITGAGKGFCAGMDLGAFAASGDRPWGGDRGFAGIVRKPPRTPMIAAMEGFGVAGGLEIALACDMIVAAKGTKLGVPEVKRGLVPAGGGMLRLPQRMPQQLASELVLTGGIMLAERAYEVGLVNRLAEPGGALETAIELAEEIAANAPLALVASKRVMAEAREWPEAEFWDRQAEIVDPVMNSEDAKEGATAFKEKRDPVWRAQ